ncbi:MAG: hypothetical protein RJQ14_11905 [Marinoscillum sp.]
MIELALKYLNPGTVRTLKGAQKTEASNSAWNYHIPQSALTAQ